MNTLQLQALKSQAHHLKPIILLGNKGLTDAVLEETNIALTTHELIKIKLSGLEREEKLPVITEICQKHNAELIQLVGNIATIYRKNPPKKTPAKKRVKKSIKKTPRQSATPRAGNRDEKRQPTSRRTTSRSSETTSGRTTESRRTTSRNTAPKNSDSQNTEPKRTTHKNITFKSTSRRTTRKP